MDILEKLQQNATRAIKRLEHLSHKDERAETVQPGNRRLRGILPMSVNTQREVVKRRGSGSFQWCPVTEIVAMGTN